jgi:GNAT superfamily N-acetyltransferase
MNSTANNLDLRVDNLLDAQKRQAWVDLLRDIFGLDFAWFSSLNIWPEDYRSFAYMDGAVIAANVSYSPLPLMLDGKVVQAGDIQGVATRPAYRSQGLFRDLMGRALSYADTQGPLTFLSTGTPSLYEAFGFRTLTEHHFTGRLEITSPWPREIDLRPVEIETAADIALVRRLFQQRLPVSALFGLAKNEEVFFTNAMTQKAWQMSYLPASDCIVVCDRRRGKRRLLDFLGQRFPSMAELGAALGLTQGDEEIDVLFSPDRLTGTFHPRPHSHHDGGVIMVRGDFPLEGRPLMMPVTAVT